MSSILLIGLFLGMRHALEADHVAAVASIVNGKYSLTQSVRLGSMWGLGHTITLCLFGLIVLTKDTVIPEHFAQGLEAAVGMMLILLGGDVIRRLIRDKVHFHSHQHKNRKRHFHAHSHQGDLIKHHQQSAHDHQHGEAIGLRPLFIGLMHGMAGSAAVIILALGTVSSVQQGLLYILLYGAGSIIGMAVLSLAISIPMRLTAQRLTWAHHGLQATAGLVSLGLGIYIVVQSSAVMLA